MARAVVARTLEHRSTGAGLRRRHHLGIREDESSIVAAVGRAARQDGLHQLCDAVGGLRLAVLRLWPRLIRKNRRGSGARYRHYCLSRTSSLQYAVVAQISFRTIGVAMAQCDVRGLAIISARLEAETLNSQDHRGV